MKKLLLITLLGLFFSANANAKIFLNTSKKIYIKCSNELELNNGVKVNNTGTEIVVLDFKKRHWKYINTIKGEEMYLIVEDNFYSSYGIKNNNLENNNTSVTIWFNSINRFTAKRISVQVNIFGKKAKRLLKLNSIVVNKGIKSKKNKIKFFYELKTLALESYWNENEGFFGMFDCIEVYSSKS